MLVCLTLRIPWYIYSIRYLVSEINCSPVYLYILSWRFHTCKTTIPLPRPLEVNTTLNPLMTQLFTKWSKVNDWGRGGFKVVFTDKSLGYSFILIPSVPKPNHFYDLWKFTTFIAYKFFKHYFKSKSFSLVFYILRKTNIYWYSDSIFVIIIQ